MKVIAIARGSGVSGVQHTGYRKYLTEIAKRHHIGFEIENRPDSTVHMVISGRPDQCWLMTAAARSGSPRARVLQVDIEIIDDN
jgi:acylphosphatase